MSESCPLCGREAGPVPDFIVLRLVLLSPKEGRKALAMADVKVAGLVVIQGIKVVPSEDGKPTVHWPSFKKEDGTRQSFVQGVALGHYKEVRKLVLHAYTEARIQAGLKEAELNG